MLRLLLVLCTLALPLQAEEQVIAALSQNRVGITASFNGSEILVFGAIRHGKPMDETRPLDVIVTVSGPPLPVTVRRKEKVAGIWVNTDAIEMNGAPSFYSVASSLPTGVALNADADAAHKVSIARAIGAVGDSHGVEDAGRFTEALIRIRKDKGLYQELGSAVSIFDGTLFRTDIELPANLVEGVYETRIFLTFDGDVVGTYRTFIDVQKVGIERWIYNLAHERPLVYGLLSLFIAVFAGWGASAIFRFVRF